MGMTQKQVADCLVASIGRVLTSKSFMGDIEALNLVVGAAQNEPAYGGKADGSISEAEWNRLSKLLKCFEGTVQVLAEAVREAGK